MKWSIIDWINLGFDLRWFLIRQQKKTLTLQINRAKTSLIKGNIISNWNILFEILVLIEKRELQPGSFRNLIFKPFCLIFEANTVNILALHSKFDHLDHERANKIEVRKT